MSDRPDISPEEGAETAEYALGLLSDAQAAAFETRLKDNPDLRAELLGWQRRFAEVADQELEPVTPPAAVETALMRRLFDDVPVAVPLWQRLGLWRALTGLAFAAAIAFAALFFWQPAPDPGPRYLAQITSDDGGLVLAAMLNQGVLHISRSQGDVAEGRVQELWLIAGDAAPVSLGVLPNDTEGVLQISAEIGDQFLGALLAISDEPLGGSPTGVVLATGPIREI